MGILLNLVKYLVEARYFYSKRKLYKRGLERNTGVQSVWKSVRETISDVRTITNKIGAETCDRPA